MCVEGILNRGSVSLKGFNICVLVVLKETLSWEIVSHRCCCTHEQRLHRESKRQVKWVLREEWVQGDLK